MAQWKETLEPYVRVHEKIKTAAINPTAGEDLIIGCVIISDTGSSIPTLINGQSEFLASFASRDLTKDYIKSLNDLYKGDVSDMAETMWLNAYRLAGSNSLLVVRASKAKDIYFSKPLIKGDNNVYLLRDGQLLKKVGNEVKFVIDRDMDSAEHTLDGWAININEVGVIGNRNTDEGAQYDYYVKDLGELVDYLNDTSKFFSPSYKFYSDEKAEVETDNADEAVSVVFEELYVGANLLDTSDSRCPSGLAYVVTCEKTWTPDNPNQKLIDLNSTAFSDFEESKFYATNKYNSSADLKIRIRRFNHDAVVSKELNTNDAYEGGNSPYTVLGTVLDTFTNNGTYIKNGKKLPAADVLERDFYEVAVLDPSVSGEPIYFNIGNILGRGDMTVAEVNESLKMIQLQLPDDMTELGLDYYGYLPETKKRGWGKLLNPTEEQVRQAKSTDDEGNPLTSKASLEGIASPVLGNVAVVGRKSSDLYKYNSGLGKWEKIESPSGDDIAAIKYEVDSLTALNNTIKTPAGNEIAKVGADIEGSYYIYKDGLSLSEIDDEEIYVDLSIDPRKYSILDVTDTDILKALDQISLDEVYTTEGLADLGCTSPMVNSYMANMAINDNYFYPISTVNSTNYLAIANSINRISQDSTKLYASAPWDVDTGSVGWKFYASPSTLYWETVGRNRALGREFAPVLGQSNGIAQYQKPVVEFNKKTRQLLLSKRINTVIWNTQTQAWNWNDNYTKSSEDNIMRDDGNSRLGIRISKAMPTLLRQFIGRRINAILWKDAYSVIDYFMKTTILPMQYTIDAYRITIDETNNPVEVQRQNKMKILVEIRFARALKYVEVYNNFFDVGMEFDGLE